MNVAACVECHSNHGIVPPKPEMLGVGRGAVCVNCHASGDPGYVGASAMKRDIDQLRAALTSSEEMLKRAEISGMEVSEGRLQLMAANEEWIKARVQVHSFRPEAVTGTVRAGLEAARKGYDIGVGALKERDVRRKGLAVSLISIAVVIVGLWLTARYLTGGMRRDTLLADRSNSLTQAGKLPYRCANGVQPLRGLASRSCSNAS
jgi:predicted CXXCH cytochrome family protein